MPHNEETDKYELSDLEKEFEEARKVAVPLIEKKLRNAKVCIDEAIKISEKYGVPFRVYLIEASNSYIPNSMKKDILEFTDYYYGGYAGWQQSYC